MNEPLDLDEIESRHVPTIVVGQHIAPTAPAMNAALHDRLKLIAEVRRLRDEIADRANVEADLRAQLAEAKAANPLATVVAVADRVSVPVDD
jgi:hypothetical protein